MTDADTDSAHQTLLLTFLSLCRPLVEAGHVYIAFPTLQSKAKARKKKWPTLGRMARAEELRKQFGERRYPQRLRS